MSDDNLLTALLEARAKAAEQCVLANQHAATIKADLIEHLNRRFQEGAFWFVLRDALIEGGVTPNVAQLLLRAAGGKPPLAKYYAELEAAGERTFVE